MPLNKPIKDTPYPIADYDDLVTAITEYMDRDDTEFLNQIPNFIDFAQKEIFRTKRYNFNAKESYLQVTNGVANLPTDWLQTDYLLFSSGWREARETSRAEVLEHMKQGYTIDNTPEIIYTRLQDRLLFSPVFDNELPTTNADGSLTITDPNTLVMGYWFDPARPSEGGSSAVNYLIKIAPDALLYSACAFASAFIQDTENEQAYANKAQAVITSLDQQNVQQDHAGVKVVKLANIREYW